ncbi:YbfB/YjiJ family MFS transporter [Sedimentitalea sp. XS_ASV28]|uniref:YbfB/YjiJ family MFS transporter n=1 Tax=Sedimentitalea sp. XS_ASV28 TaxID=3241296 RepID=UPI00351422F7
MSNEPARPWLVLLGLALGMCVTNSFARFAYGLMLPAMKAEMGWTYAQAGWLNTANAMGYIVGSVLTMALIGRMSASRLFALGMATTTVALIATGLHEAMWWQTLWRLAAGLFGAMSFASSGALAAQLFQNDARRNALAIALLFGFGGGLGIVLSGAVLPLLLDAYGPTAWPRGWLFIGVTSVCFLPLGLWAARQLRAPSQDAPAPARLPVRRMLSLFAGYGSFGLGYFVYLTFLSAWMTEQQASAQLIAMVWVMLGLCLCISPFVWRPVFARFNSGIPLAMILACISLGSALPVLVPGPLGLLVSATVFGLSVFMSPGAVTNFIRHNLPLQSWGAAISLFTVVFAVSQTVGPYAAGWLGDRTSSIGTSLLAAAAVLLAGAGLATMQKPLHRD